MDTKYSDSENAKYLREWRKKRRPADYEPTRTGRWKPGESGNPAGRPKRLPLSEAQAALLDKFGDFEALKAKLAAGVDRPVDPAVPVRSAARRGS